MTMNRFNMYLIEAGLGKQDNTGGPVFLFNMIDYKDTTKKFKANEKLIERYNKLYKTDKAKASSLKIRNNILFY